MKRLLIVLIATFCITSNVYADWMDELPVDKEIEEFVESESIEAQKAQIENIEGSGNIEKQGKKVKGRIPIGEVLYCVDTQSTGFRNGNFGIYEQTKFYTTRFKIKLNNDYKELEMVFNNGLRLDYSCESLVFNEELVKFNEHDVILQCTAKNLSSFNISIYNGRYTLSNASGYVRSDKKDIAISFGKCDKF